MALHRVISLLYFVQYRSSSYAFQCLHSIDFGFRDWGGQSTVVQSTVVQSTVVQSNRKTEHSSPSCHIHFIFFTEFLSRFLRYQRPFSAKLFGGFLRL
jgi:hypothetical protein